jgi:NADH dehydrogenase (ubiquinone) 1 alpha subcomplex subunit 13
MATPPIQDFAPKGGFPSTIRYARNLPRRGPSGAVVLAAVFGIMTYGFMKTAEGNLERRY